MTPSDITPRIHRTAGQGPEQTCWRMAAIYRVCLRRDVTRSWVQRKIREVFPCGSRDGMADIWMAHQSLMQRTRREMTDTLTASAARAA